MFETLRVQAVHASGALALVGDQPGLFEYPEVLRDGGPAHRNSPRDLADGQGAIQEKAGQNCSSGAVSEGVQLDVFVSIH